MKKNYKLISHHKIWRLKNLFFILYIMLILIFKKCWHKMFVKYKPKIFRHFTLLEYNTCLCPFIIFSLSRDSYTMSFLPTCVVMCTSCTNLVLHNIDSIWITFYWIIRKKSSYAWIMRGANTGDYSTEFHRMIRKLENPQREHAPIIIAYSMLHRI